MPAEEAGLVGPKPSRFIVTNQQILFHEFRS
jgi:hypothetical protein